MMMVGKGIGMADRAMSLHNSVPKLAGSIPSFEG